MTLETELVAALGCSGLCARAALGCSGLRARVLLVLVLVGAVVGCVDRVDVAAPPGLDAGSSIVLAIFDGKTPVDFFAADVDDGGRVELPLLTGFHGRTKIVAFVFACSIAANVPALKTGWQRLTDDFVLPPGGAMYALEPDAAGAGWTELDEVPDGVAIAESSRCATLDISNAVTIPGTRPANPQAIEALDDDRILLSTAHYELLDGRLVHWWIVTRDGQVLRLDHIPEETADRVAFQAPDGTIWLAGLRGDVLHGTIEAGFVRTGTLATRNRDLIDMWIDGTRDPALPFEMFLVTSTGTFERFDGATNTWTLLSDFGPCVLSPSACEDGGVQYLGENRAVAAVPGPFNSFIFYDHGVTTRVTYDLGGINATTTTVVQVPNFGLMAGNAVGSILYGIDETGPHGLIGAIGEKIERLFPLDESFVCECNRTLTEYTFGPVEKCPSIPIGPILRHIDTNKGPVLIVKQPGGELSAVWVTYRRDRIAGCPLMND